MARRGLLVNAVLIALWVAVPLSADEKKPVAGRITPQQLQEQLLRQQERIEELERLVRQQVAVVESLREQLAGQRGLLTPAAASVSGSDSSDDTAETEQSTGQAKPVAPADSSQSLNEKITKLEKRSADLEKGLGARLRGLGNFHFSGDVRLRWEPFFQGGGFVTRQRERIRARLNMTGNLTEEISGGISLATNALDDVNSPNQSLTGFFTRKPIGFDRFYVTYKPKWFRALSLTGGKIAYPWYRTPLTFDNDINPEGFAQTLSFDFKNPALKNLTLVGFQLPFNETATAHDSFIFGGQLQTRWKLSDRVGLRLYAAGLNFIGADAIAVAVAGSAIRPSLPNTNPFRTNAAGQVVGYASKFLYLDLISVVDYNWRPRWPIQFHFDFVNNTRANSRERTAYWGELQFGRLAEQGDLQFSYSLIRIERDAVIGAYNESDVRASTNVRNHRLFWGYQAMRNVSVTYALWIGRLANPHDSAGLTTPHFRGSCGRAPFLGCSDPYLKRMQLDLLYRF